MPKKINIVITVGTEVDDTELGNERVGSTSITPTEDIEVEAQDYLDIQMCPGCGTVGYGVEDDYIYRVFRCHSCGTHYRT